MYQEDYSEKLRKEISGLRLGSPKEEVRNAWKQILEYRFPKQTDDCPGGGFVHKYLDYESEFPHIGIINPRGEHSYLPVFHVYCQSLPAAAGESVLPCSRTHWRALKDAVKFELVGIVSLIKRCKPNLYAAIAAGPLVRFCGVNKKGKFWDLALMTRMAPGISTMITMPFLKDCRRFVPKLTRCALFHVQHFA
ncbi:hypothetical protein IFM61606_04914 [Aspergillus udagawae]|nr:hypothetical protein IFM5058_05632 [Aspergillus udagawae]GFG24988.1 hypothetical protein IFM61606_04914 [Aspergillus udagawae]